MRTHDVQNLFTNFHLKIVENESLEGSDEEEKKSLNSKHNFTFLMKNLGQKICLPLSYPCFSIFFSLFFERKKIHFAYNRWDENSGPLDKI